MFDYEEYKKVAKNLSLVEERVIHEHFEEIIRGNSDFEDMSQPEFDSYFDMFRKGWILHGMFVKR